MKDDIYLEGAIQRYKGYLHMIKINKEMKSKSFFVPTYDIDLIWHTHQLHPLSYYNDMMSLLGNVLDHDDTDSDRTKGQKLDIGFSQTTKRWKEMFLSRYWRAGAMYMRPVHSQNNCVNPCQSSEIMFVEVWFLKSTKCYITGLVVNNNVFQVMVEVTEMRSLPSKHKGNFVLSIGKKQQDMLLKDKHHLRICTENEEIQAVLFMCEPKGVLLFDLLDGYLKSLGTCLISLSELESKLPTPTWFTFESGIALP